MSIEERIVSIKFDNTGFKEKIKETKDMLKNFNSSLKFPGAKEGAEEVKKSFKEISDESKKVDMNGIGKAVETVKDKFNVLEKVATGALMKIGWDAVELGKKLMKSISVDPIAKGFQKYQEILTSQMTLTAALGGETEKQIADNAQLITDTLQQLTWYADETSYSLESMISNVSKFANYGIDLDDAKLAMMGIANASAKSGAPLANAAHAMEGFSKAMGQGYMSYQVWRSWLNTSQITTLDFKKTFIDTGKEMLKAGVNLGQGIQLLGNELQYYGGKTEGWITLTAENIETSLTKAKWLTKDVMLAGLAKYAASMDDLYEATEQGSKSVSALFAAGDEGFDKFSTDAFKYAQQCKTLEDVLDALFDATSTTWYGIFQTLIGDYKQTVSLWSDFAEYLFEWFVYPLQDFAGMLREFSESNSSIIDETTGKIMTMRDVIVGAFMNILEAISSFINPIKEAFTAVFNPLENLPDKLQTSAEKIYIFTEKLILTEEKAEKLRNTFIGVFTVFKKIHTIIQAISTVIKKVLYPIVQKVFSITSTVLSYILRIIYKIAATVSTFLSNVFGITDYIEELKDEILDTAHSIDELTGSLEENAFASKNNLDTYTKWKDLLEEFAMNADSAAESMDDLEDSKKTKKKSNMFLAPSYEEATEGTVNPELAKFIKEQKISEKQYNEVADMINAHQMNSSVFNDKEDWAVQGMSADKSLELKGIIERMATAYSKTDRAITNILNKDKEAMKWSTIWDGISEAQHLTSITYNEQQEALRLYFSEGIKDYTKIADAVGIEEWKVRQIIKAYEEAYAIENRLAQKKLEATADNIDLMRQELGLIKRKKDEQKKEEKKVEDMSRRELAQHERKLRNEARLAKVKERQNRMNKRTSSSTSEYNGVLGKAIKTAVSSSKAFSLLNDVFKVTNRYTNKTTKNVKTLSTEIKEAIDPEQLAKETFIKQSNEKIVESLDETKVAANKVTASIKEIGDSGKKASDSLNSSAQVMVDTLKEMEHETEVSAEGISGNIAGAFDILGDGSINNQNKGSLYNTFSNIFEEFNKNEKIEGFEKEVKSRVTRIITWVRQTFTNLFKGTQKDAADATKKTIKSILDILKNINIKDSLSKIWNDVKSFLKNKVNEIKTDKENPFYGIVLSIEEMYINAIAKINDVFTNIKKKIKKPINRMKDLLKVFKSFKTGDWFATLSDGSLWRPLIDWIDKVITKFDDLSAKIKGIPKAINSGIKSAIKSTNSNIEKGIENLKKNMRVLGARAQGFFMGIEAAAEVIRGGGPQETGVQKGGLIWFLAKCKVRWEHFVEELKDGLDWDTIMKIDELEKILGRLIRVIGSTWLKIGLAKMAQGIGDLFSNVASSLDNLTSVVKKKEDIGKLLLQIAFAVLMLVGAFMALGTMDAGALASATAALKQIYGVLALLFGLVSGMLLKMQGSGKKFGKATSLSQALGNGLESWFGNKNTMKQAAYLIVGIGAGILLMAAAFKVLTKAIDVSDPETVEKSLRVLKWIVGILVAAIIFIKWAMEKFGGKGGISGGIDISNKTINKTISPIAEILKGFAVALLSLIAGFVAISMVIDKYYKNEDGTIDYQKFAVTGLVLTLMAGAVMAFAIEMARKAQQLKGVDAKTLTAMSKMMKPFVLGLSTLIYGFRALTKIIDKIKSPKTFKHATALLAGMTVGMMALMILITGLAKMITTGKDTSDVNIVEYANGDGKQKDIFKKNKSFTGGENVAKSITEITKVMAAIGVAIKLIASAYSSIVTSIDNIKNPKTFSTSIGIFAGIFGGFFLIISIFALLAKVSTPESSATIKALGITMLLIAASVLIVGKAITNMAEAFQELASKEGGKDAVNKALLTISIFIGAIVGIFAILSAISSTGVGAAALGAGAVILIAIAASIVLIAVSVYILSKGLSVLVDAFIKAASAGEELAKGVDVLIGLMPKIGELIRLFVRAIIGGFVGGLWEARADLAIMLTKIILAIIEMMSKYAPKIMKALSDFMDGLSAEMPTFIDALERFLEAAVDGLLDLCYTGGKIRLKIKLIPVALWAGFIDEFRNLIGLNKDGKVIKDRNDPDSIWSIGRNIILGLIEGIKECIGDLKKKARELWDSFKNAFTGKDGADMSSPSKKTRTYGNYIGEGLVQGMDDSAKAIGKAAIRMSDSIMDPMDNSLSSFSAVTSSMLAQLLDADMNFDPVITPIFDMSNLDSAASSMDDFFSSKKAMTVSGSFADMKNSQTNANKYQNGGISDETAAPAFSYVQNNYSPKALSAIEIYRRTKNQLTFRTQGG